MKQKDEILNVLKKYGFYSLNRAPYLYQNKEKTGIYFAWPNKHYGMLERVLYFDKKEDIEEEVFKYWWFINHKNIGIEVEFDNYEVISPQVFYKYKGMILTSSVMKNFDQNKLIDPKESLQRKQLLRTATILIMILEEKFKIQNETYMKVESLKNELDKLHNEYNKKLKEYQNGNEEKREEYEVLMDDLDESSTVIQALHEELSTLETSEDIRAFINKIFTYLSNIDMSDVHLQNIYLLNRYPFEIDDMKQKILVLNNALTSKKRFFKSKNNVGTLLADIEHKSECNKMININVYIDKEKKQMEEKYQNRENINEYVLGDYLADFDKLNLNIPPIIDNSITNEEISREDLIKEVKEIFEKLSKKEKSACYIAASFLKDCLNVLMEQNVENELNVNEVISKIVIDNKIEMFDEAYKILDHYTNAKIRVKYFSIIKMNSFETFVSSLIQVIEILKEIMIKIDHSFYAYYKNREQGIISLYLKNIYTYSATSFYVGVVLPNVHFYYSPVSIIKQLDIVDNVELVEKENDSIFLMKEKVVFKNNPEKKVAVKYEKDKIINKKDYVIVTNMKEKNRISYFEDMLYNKEEGDLNE